ncbi:MAG TPA: DUF305 domain-containing protein [Kineosporiaceae bacterium]
MSAHRTRLLSAAPALGLAVVLAACGGGSGADTTSPAGSAAASSGGSSAAASATSSGMAGMPGMSSGAGGASSGGTAALSYPPVTPGPAAKGAHNAEDVAFATGMIPHHGQAVEMADMVLAKTGNPQVKALAEQIKKAQSPEIAILSGWLKGWGQKVPDPHMAMSGDMGGMTMTGMMSDAQMKQIEDATGISVDKVFLTLMQEHHSGAIAMAKTELAKGANPEAKKLAQTIITSQSAELTQMKKMVAALG